MESTMPKIEKLRAKCPSLDIQVDGGVSLKTVETVAEAGANVIVVGSAIFKAENAADMIEALRQSAENAVK